MAEAQTKDDVSEGPGDSYTSDNSSEGSFTYLFDESREIHTKSYRKWFVVLTVAAAFLAIILARVYRNTSGFAGSSDKLESMPMALLRDVDERVMSMFVEFDTNMDGAIDLGEFAPIANRILDRKETADKGKLSDPKPEDTWDFNGELITIESYFTPLVLSSMSKYNGPSALLSTVAERHLADKNSVFDWLPQHDEAFAKIRRLVTLTPVLHNYNVNKEVTTECDSSVVGLGAVITQEGHPIAYASRALTETEHNYAQIEKECLAIVFASD